MGSAIQLNRVTKIWNEGEPGAVTAVDSLSLQVGQGEFVVLLGPSGCGKSSLLYLLAGLEQPSAGELLCDGARVAGPAPERSMIFQEASLYPWLTVLDNVALGLRLQGVEQPERDSRAQALLRQVGLGDMGQRRPHELSGGMRQRVALARALAMKPKVLLMDEPFAALDVQTRARMQGHLLEVWRASGASVLLVTHSIDEALALADRIVVFTARPGRVKHEVSVALPRPRNPHDPRMVDLHRQLTELLADEVDRAFLEQETR
ncbi:ABC transporter ATP-binding protein [Piscinibacter sp.]|jgi:NitT/TauT family transport system ATP-binding protein|uniref:ABC transporter ATP-binding protein n=1 Tax=Piscinibacter sp. TaxID=1903157 RepID=UPI001B5A1832|nr:ABC transporter ATP-binding protein [Piscinibacter sp.]MBK7530951.1 ABC transporter ATP-binding protein [Piscinibacter sp.]MBP6544220.1 ABC transporter ATP-binding protein [Piscinibacter sp.]